MDRDEDHDEVASHPARYRGLAPWDRMDPAGFFSENRSQEDRRRICGFAPLYALLSAVPATRGRLLRYEQSPECDLFHSMGCRQKNCLRGC